MLKMGLHVLLYGAFFWSAIELITVRHAARYLFVDIQQYEKQRDDLNEEWGRLKLEQRTLATDDRIESFAKDQLGMKIPQKKLMVLLTQ